MIHYEPPTDTATPMFFASSTTMLIATGIVLTFSGNILVAWIMLFLCMVLSICGVVSKNKHDREMSEFFKRIRRAKLNEHR